MADHLSTTVRSKNMSAVKGYNTAPELYVRKKLFENGFRYRLNVKLLPGKPDIVLKKYKIIIFINGCFWHGHKCKKGKRPGTNKKFWNNKINANILRDKNNYKKLERPGWKIVIIWTCDLKSQTEKLVAKMLQLRAKLTEKHIYK